MLIKAYIKRSMFHLPMLTQDLENQLKEKLNKTEIDKDTFFKTNALTKVEDSDEILVKGQHTNIFYLNLLLQLTNKKELDLEEGYYNDNFIIEKIQEIINVDIKGLPYAQVEEKVFGFLEPKPSTNEEEKENAEKGVEAEPTKENVEFNLSFLKKLHNSLKRKKG